MKRIFNYERQYNVNRITGSAIDLGNAGTFMEVRSFLPEKQDELVIDNAVFRSIHIIEPRAGKRIFTAYRSEELISVLLIVWENFPFYRHIEEGGDFMLQELYSTGTLKHLIIDNTYVMSGWMEEKTVDYMNQGWIPGLIELGLMTFCHLQAESYLGGKSYEEFMKFVSGSVNSVADKLGREGFIYCPVKTSEISKDGKIDEAARLAALKKGVEIIRSAGA